MTPVRLTLRRLTPVETLAHGGREQKTVGQQQDMGQTKTVGQRLAAGKITTVSMSARLGHLYAGRRDRDHTTSAHRLRPRLMSAKGDSGRG